MHKRTMDDYFAKRPCWRPAEAGWYYFVGDRVCLHAQWKTIRAAGYGWGAIITLVDESLKQSPSPVPFPLVPENFGELRMATERAEEYVRRRVAEVKNEPI